MTLFKIGDIVQYQFAEDMHLLITDVIFYPDGTVNFYSCLVLETGIMKPYTLSAAPTKVVA